MRLASVLFDINEAPACVTARLVSIAGTLRARTEGEEQMKPILISISIHPLLVGPGATVNDLENVSKPLRTNESK